MKTLRYSREFEEIDTTALRKGYFNCVPFYKISFQKYKRMTVIFTSIMYSWENPKIG